MNWVCFLLGIHLYEGMNRRPRRGKDVRQLDQVVAVVVYRKIDLRPTRATMYTSKGSVWTTQEIGTRVKPLAVTHQVRIPCSFYCYPKVSFSMCRQYRIVFLLWILDDVESGSEHNMEVETLWCSYLFYSLTIYSR